MNPGGIVWCVMQAEPESDGDFVVAVVVVLVQPFQLSQRRQAEELQLSVDAGPKLRAF